MFNHDDFFNGPLALPAASDAPRRRRVRELVLGRPLLRDRNEEEVRGYRDALGYGAVIFVLEELIL